MKLLDRFNAAGAIILGYLIFGLWYPITEKITGVAPDHLSYFKALDDKTFEVFDSMIVRLNSKGYDVCPCYNHFCLRMVLFHPAQFLIESQDDDYSFDPAPFSDDEDEWDAWEARQEEKYQKKRALRPWYLK